MEKINIKIEGMGCEHCINAIKKELGKLPLEKFTVNLGSAEIIFNPAKTALEKIKNAIKTAGYKITK
ncbi:MAG: heavy-metal-associated domain-containing protein [Ignavibacteria bacterium]|nr:heavy-metal-associated domain-containing protein [Ignavibacteria bacterium]